MNRLWQGFVRFNRGLAAMPVGWRLWVLFLGAVNVVPALFFLDHLEGRVVPVVMAASALLMITLTGFFGFTRLLGAGHSLWLGLLPWIISRWSGAPIDEPFGLWLRLLVVVNATSLAIDVVDVARFVRGERDEVVDLG